MNIPLASSLNFAKGWHWLCLLMLLSSCGMYKNRILFQTDTSVIPENVRIAVAEADGNYTLQENDYIQLKVYTNGGEMMIDPNREILREIGGTTGNSMQHREDTHFLIRKGGVVKLPMVGNVQVEGLTVYQLDSVLEQKYSHFYEDVFVITKYLNKRVVVLGATGGQVIPLENENTNLLEILALAGGVSMQARADNIRLIRGDLNNPEVHVINLTTIEGMKKSSLQVLPGDIIYVEPIQKIAREAIGDITPILGLFTSLLTLALFITRLD